MTVEAVPDHQGKVERADDARGRGGDRRDGVDDAAGRGRVAASGGLPVPSSASIVTPSSGRPLE